MQRILVVEMTVGGILIAERQMVDYHCVNGHTLGRILHCLAKQNRTPRRTSLHPMKQKIGLVLEPVWFELELVELQLGFWKYWKNLRKWNFRILLLCEPRS